MIDGWPTGVPDWKPSDCKSNSLPLPPSPKSVAPAKLNATACGSVEPLGTPRSRETVMPLAPPGLPAASAKLVSWPFELNVIVPIMPGGEVGPAAAGVINLPSSSAKTW
ncbi:MAG: hypothetical protein WDN30_08465 [Pararobbsia sp.]